MRKATRRTFLKTCGALAFGTVVPGGCTAPRSDPPAPRTDPLIDTHVHFYDPSRPQGAPWPPKNDTVLYRTVLPPDYQRIAKPLGVTGVVVVEASPWVEDNQWLLDLAEREPFILGIVGNLGPGDSDFAGNLARFARNPLYRGIRLRERPWQARLDGKMFIDDLHRLADANLAMDINAPPAALPDMIKLAERAPTLHIVVDHVGNLAIDGSEPPADWRAAMKSLAALPNVWCKVSGLVEGAGRAGKTPSKDLAFYRPVLDALWETLGPRRLLYSSNWPVSAKFAELATVQELTREYFAEKGSTALGMVFAGNAGEAYRCVRGTTRSS